MEAVEKEDVVIIKEQTACFTGHREIPLLQLLPLKEKLRKSNAFLALFHSGNIEADGRQSKGNRTAEAEERHQQRGNGHHEAGNSICIHRITSSDKVSISYPFFPGDASASRKEENHSGQRKRVRTARKRHSHFVKVAVRMQK